MEATVSKTCGVEGCKRPYRAKGFCNVHFKKWRRGEMPQKPRYKRCQEEGCRKPMGQWGLCEEHFQARLKTKQGVSEAPEAPPLAVKEEAPAPPAKEVAPVKEEAPPPAKEESKAPAKKEA